MKIDVKNLSVRMVSPALRFIALGILVAKQDGMAAEILLLLSYIYLVQVLFGLELYTKAEIQFSAHISNFFVIHGFLALVSFIVIDVFTFYVALFFFVDSIINEIIRKSVILGKLLFSNIVLLGKASGFFLASVLAQTVEVFWIYISLQSAVILSISCTYLKLKFETNFFLLIALLRKISLNPIAIAIFLRTIDISLREKILQEYKIWADELSVLVTIGILSATITMHGVMGGEIKNIYSKVVKPNYKYFLFMIFINILLITIAGFYFMVVTPITSIFFIPSLFYVIIGTIIFCTISLLGAYYIGLSNALNLRADLTAILLTILSTFLLLQSFFASIPFFCFLIYILGIVTLILRLKTEIKVV